MPIDPDRLKAVATDAGSRAELWAQLVALVGARRIAEIGVYRGEFAAALLDACPDITQYYMVDPWRHLDDWNKPANQADDRFQTFYEETLARTEAHAAKRVVLRGRTTEVIDEVPDGELDLAYVDGDHTLRGITIDLVRVLPKIRPGGFIGGDDFRPSIWQHKAGFEPTLVFPYAVHFAEAVGARIYALPYRQFLMERAEDGRHAFVDLTGSYGSRDLLPQLDRRPEEPTAAETTAPSSSGIRRAAGRLRRRLGG